MSDPDMRRWQPIESAPKDGTVVELRFKGGWHYTHKGQRPRRIQLDAGDSIGKWWSAEVVLNAVGRKKSEAGARGALLARNGGYWGSAGKKSRPMAGNPTHWRPFTGTLLHPVDPPDNSLTDPSTMGGERE